MNQHNGQIKINAALFLSVVCCIALFSCHSGSPLEDRMQTVLDKGIEKYDANGVSAAVIFPDDRIWTGVSGISHDTVSIKPDMIFAIGSITKNFIAALTLTLVEDKVLYLNDPLSKWLPEYPNVHDHITIRQLLNHTSGLYMFWDNQQLWDELTRDRTKYWTPEEVLSYIKEPYFEAGEGWRYSNTNYLLLAMIINKVTGSNLATQLKKRFCEPLGITDLYISQEESLPANLAHVYGDNFQFGGSAIDVTFLPRVSHESITYGSSGIFTTSKSLARWSHALFGGKILEEKSLNEMLTFIEFKPAFNMRGYGLGVQKYAKRFSWGEPAIGHGGGNIGTTTYMVYLPDYQVSVVVMVNAFPNRTADVITRGLIKTVLEDLNAFSMTRYLWTSINFYKSRMIVMLAIVSWIMGITYLAVKRRNSLRHREEAPDGFRFNG